MLQFAEKMSAAASEIIICQERGSTQIKQSMVGHQELPERNEVIKNEDDIPDEKDFAGSLAVYRFNGSLNYINIKVWIVE